MSTGSIVIGMSGTFLGILTGLAFAGAGSGFLLTNLNAWITAVTPETVRGRALSALSSAFFLGQFLSPVVIRPVSEAAALDTTFLGVGDGLAGGVIAFALTAVYATPITSEPVSDERPR